MASSVRVTDVRWDRSGTLVWHEWRSGTGVLAALPGAAPGVDAPVDLTAGLSVRAGVGYGGGEFTVQDRVVYFVATDGRLYRLALAGGPARPITPAFGAAASPEVSPDGRWVVFVHSYEGVDALAVVDAAGRYWPQKLVEGDDFYMQPHWHPSGRLLAFVSWRHPNMPWDGSLLHLAHLDIPPGDARGVAATADGGGLPRVVSVEAVAGSDRVAVFQPTFSPDGRWLAYVSDETGWPNVHAMELETRRVVPLLPEPAEHWRTPWAQGMRTLAWAPDGRVLYVLRSQEGLGEMWAIDVEHRQAGPVGELPYTAFAQIATSPASGDLACLASAPGIPERVVVVDARSAAGAGQGAAPGRSRQIAARVVRRTMAEDIPPERFSAPRPIAWQTGDSTEERAYGLFYTPAGPQPWPSGLPPLIVRVHGGPTGQASARWDPDVQFLTTRGYAVLDVNYRGSAGYGRGYRDALKGHWGVYDVEDCVSGARHVAEQGLADGRRMAIMGGSAGGYTVLRSLVTHPGFFRCGVCLFGVSNLFTLAMETHKFEAHYTDSLVGPLPEAAALYRERSPVFHADRIADPIAIFHGEEDRVVPKNQADAIVEVLRRRGVPHEYHVYAGEGHGWRRAETVEAYYASVESFLRRYLVFA